MAGGDDLVPREELENSQATLAALQRIFDEFQTSSRETEEELEEQLSRAQDQVSELTNRLAEQAERLGDQQAKTRALHGEVAAAQAETRRLRAAAAREATEKASLEQAADELEAKCRAASAAEEDFRHKLDLAIEEKIFVCNDIEDLRADTLRTEQGLRAEIEDLRQELGRLGVSQTSSPGLVLPSAISASEPVSTAPAEEGAEAMPEAAGSVVAESGHDLGVGDISDDGEGIAGGGDDAERDPEATDDLIKAYEEELQMLRTQLEESEANNDELNLMLQELQERQFLDGAGAGGVGSGGGSGVEVPGAPEGETSPRSMLISKYELEVTELSKEVSQAETVCEELDEMNSFLVDQLKMKDEQNIQLSEHQAELEKEMASRSQMLEDEVSKAKTGIASLETRLADAEAELRATDGRLEEASGKVASGQEREEMFREELASLKERVRELTLARTSLSEEVSSREAQLEEALISAERLRADVENLQERVNDLTAQLAQEAEARRQVEQSMKEKLMTELAAERARMESALAVANAKARAAETETADATTATEMGDLNVQVSDKESLLDGDGANRGGQGEGQSSGEPGEGEESGEGGRGLSAAGQTSASDKEMEQELAEETARLKRALEEAQRKAAISSSGGVSKDHAGASVAAAMESGDVESVKMELQSLAESYWRERGKNASLLSKMRALKGNIEVVCRIRPPTSEEIAAEVPIALEALGDGELGVKIMRDGTRPGGHGTGTGASGSGSTSWRSFTLDRVLGPSTTQEEVFREVEPLALSAAEGMNACIFAYGQTGSGKTHTMIGDARGGELAGVSYRTMNKLFEVLLHRQQQQVIFVIHEGRLVMEHFPLMHRCSRAFRLELDPGTTSVRYLDRPFKRFAGIYRGYRDDYSFSVRVAMLEIYNEEVRDLLTSDSSATSSGSGAGGAFGDSAGIGGMSDTGGSGDGAAASGSLNGGKLEIRRGQDGMVQVPGLTYIAVTSAQEVLELLERGGSARAVAATGVHDHSSRSHSVLLAEVATREGPDTLPSTGRLFLVDLAGSERVKVSGVTGAGLREATHINSSLSALGDVMQALDQKQRHVPYRNSKLTFLLQDALGGNSRTAMVVTVCPTTLNVDETLFALQFATRARNVSLGPAQRNVTAKNLLEDLKELRARLREAARKKEHAEEALTTLQREHTRSQQKMGALLDARAKNSGDVRHQLQGQIDSMKSQLADSQARFMVEHNKRASLQGDLEEHQRQLKRSQAKVAALGRDREDLEGKLQRKQEEITDLKAERRKAYSEFKTSVRRLSAGRSGAGAGLTPRGSGSGGDADIVAPAKGPPHTPSKKLSEAKSRYSRTMREGSMGKLTSHSSVNISRAGDDPPSPANASSLPRASLSRGISHYPPAVPEPHLAPDDELKTASLSTAPTDSFATASALSEGASSSEGPPIAIPLAEAVSLVDITPVGISRGGTATAEAIEDIPEGLVEATRAWPSLDEDSIGIATAGEATTYVVNPDGMGSGVYMSSDASEEDERAQAGREGVEMTAVGAAAEAAAAIAAATAMFAKGGGSSLGRHDASTALAGVGGSVGMEVGERYRAFALAPVSGDIGRGDPRHGAQRPKGGSGPITSNIAGSGGNGRTIGSATGANFSRPTASSISRLRLSAPPVPAPDGNAAASAGLSGGSTEALTARTNRRAGVVAKPLGAGDEHPGPTSARNRAPSPTGRVARATRLHSSSSSASSTGGSRSGSRGKARPASPSPATGRPRSSFPGVSSANASTVASIASASSISIGGGLVSRSGRASSPLMGRSAGSSRAAGSCAHGGAGGGSRGSWLGDMMGSNKTGAESAGDVGDPGMPASSASGAVAGSGGAGDKSGPLATRTQIALMRHQERMNRIREMRDRKAARGREGGGAS